jgi:hypothetical protein
MTNVHRTTPGAYYRLICGLVDDLLVVGDADVDLAALGARPDSADVPDEPRAHHGHADRREPRPGVRDLERHAARPCRIPPLAAGPGPRLRRRSTDFDLIERGDWERVPTGSSQPTKTAKPAGPDNPSTPSRVR